MIIVDELDTRPLPGVYTCLGELDSAGTQWLSYFIPGSTAPVYGEFVGVGGMNSAKVRFADGHTVITSRYFVRKLRAA